MKSADYARDIATARHYDEYLLVAHLLNCACFDSDVPPAEYDGLVHLAYGSCVPRKKEV
jgi:hypothetical protein